ncbi:SRPBCC family protein [Saccharospirillum mangrovi]|uniref:SRPBCC family protein n=1 Tax=Saccharospirillum mangrovi TaxID=2161747 RepID=UPI0013006F35|nr:SRPBCC family protein [Saccharospirillum mangrovi]
MIKLASFTLVTETAIEPSFLYLSDMTNFGDWFPEVIRIVEQEPGDIGLGKIWLEDVKVPGKGIQPVAVTVVDYRPTQFFATEGNLDGIQPRMEIQLSQAPSGRTKIEWTFYSRNTRWTLRLLAPLLRSVMGKRARKGQRNLLAKLATLS